MRVQKRQHCEVTIYHCAVASDSPRSIETIRPTLETSPYRISRAVSDQSRQNFGLASFFRGRDALDLCALRRSLDHRRTEYDFVIVVTSQYVAALESCSKFEDRQYVRDLRWLNLVRRELLHGDLHRTGYRQYHQQAARLSRCCRLLRPNPPALRLWRDPRCAAEACHLSLQQHRRILNERCQLCARGRVGLRTSLIPVWK